MNGKIFEMEKEKFLTMYSDLKSVAQVSKYTGYGVDAIRSYMKRNNIKLKFKTKYTCDENLFSKDTEESFYWAGFLAADGSIQNRNRNYPFLTKLSLAKKDINHLIKFRDCLKSNHPIYEYSNKNGHECCELSICSKQMCQDLNRFNVVPRKTHILSFPIHVINNSLENHFIRGYIDGDGGFGRYLQKGRNTPQTSMTVVGTFDFLQTLHQIIDRNCGFDSQRKLYKSSNIYKIGYSGNKVISKIHDFLYKDANIYMERKFNLSKVAKQVY